ncbi:MAG: hypothetical protein KA163_01685 [Bacteroidia bacterium]|nr:hypothetical protein [Bacteroidia bacterium]
MENLKSVAAIYLALLSFTCYVIIYTYPAGDWIAGPFTIMIFGAPIVITHVGLCVYYYTKSKGNWIIWVSAILSLFSLINVTHYVFTH